MMLKIGNNNLLKRILVMILCLAIVCVTLPNADYSVKVEAATLEGVYNMKVGDATGFHDIPANTPYKYTGLKDRTTLQIKGLVDGNETFLQGIDYTWTSNAPEVISIENDGVSMRNNYEADITRQGPGVATITVNFTPTGSTSTISVSRVISVSTEIDKSSTWSSDTNRDVFTKLVLGNVDTNNTALLFFKDSGDIVSEKTIELLNGTKSRTNTVRWKTDNSDIAIVSQEAGNEVDGSPKPVVIKALKAGIANITAEAISDPTINDSFKVLVMPTFLDNNEPIVNNKMKKIIGTKTSPVIMYGGDRIETNAINAKTLKWGVTPINSNLATNMLKMEPDIDNNSFIEREPKAGTYKITAQTVDSGMSIDSNLGVATAYIKIPFQKPNVTDLVLGLNDTYNILENCNIQEFDDFTLTPNPANQNKVEISSNGIILAKKTGLVSIKIQINAADAYDKYGITFGSQEYQDYVTDGIILNFSIVDGFGINNSDITIPLKGSANLSLTTSSTEPIKWMSSNDKIVEITSTNGKISSVTGLQVGTATITVTQKVDGVTKVATCKVTVVKSAETIAIDPASVDMNVNDTKMITAKLTPNNMLVGNLKWSSSDEKVVKIDSQSGSNATIKGIGDGTAIITVINTDNAIIATCKVTVHGKSTGVTVTPADSTVNLSSKTLQLKAVVQPATNVQPELSWLSSDTDVATVDKKGLVTFKKSGNVKITVFVKNNPDISGSSNIKIIKNVEGFKIDAESKVMYAGESLKLPYTLTPSDAANQKINWTSSKPSVATVDSKGNIIALTVGEATIIGQTEDGRYMDTINILVKQKAKNIKITTKDVTLNKGDIYDIKYTLEPGTSTEVDLKWESVNTKVATVTQTGKVTAISVGSTIVIVRTAGGEVAYCNITVLEEAEGIKLNYEEKTIYRGKSFTLYASLVPESTTNRKVTWKSSKPSVATVSNKGQVKGIKVGTTIITVTSEDGGYTAICVVTVKEMVTKIKLNHTFYAVGLKKTFKLTPKVTSTNATNPKVSFTSSNKSIAYVNSKGQVTGRKTGYANITVKALDGSGAKAICKVRVVRPTSKIKLNRTIMTMIEGRSTKLKPTISPKNTTYKSVLWSSSNPKVARVLKDGTITALTIGTTVITAKSRDSGGKIKAECYVTVRKEVSANGVSVTAKEPMLVVGEKKNMTYALTPYNSTDKVTWESDNSAVASINKSTGLITAKNAGNATIIAISESGKMDSTTISVVGLNMNNLVVEQYDPNIELTVIGATAGIRWYSENPNIASVQNGKIIPKSVGKTRIVAEVRGTKLYCKVRVISMK